MIKFTNVFKAFPKGGLALKDVSFHIAKGEFVVLTGHSGAGKSTVLKLIYAEEPVTSGEVRGSGVNLAQLRRRDVPRPRPRLGNVSQVVRPRGGRAARPGRDAVNLVIREALLTFRRAPLLSTLSVTTIAFSLFVVGLFGLVAVNLQDALRGGAERVEIVAYLLPGTPIETITLAEKDIETFPEVQSATYVSEDSALGRARGELVEFRDVLQELERNPLPASIEVKLTPRFRDAEHVNEVAERLRGFGFVDDVRFGRDWVEKLARLRQIAAAVGLVVGAAFAVVAIIIIGTTIRMAVLQRSRE